MGGRKKILVVEEDIVTRLSIAQTLIRDGFCVSYAEDGISALEQVKKTKPDLIICSLMAPKIDAQELQKAVHELLRAKHTPIVYLTEESLLGLGHVDAEGGRIEYLTKPFTRDQLVMTVQKTLSRKPLKPH
ncbi:MAG: response regulator [Ignavibacteria bacterium]|nr:response regulator [Ignavibacteria bacterium]